LVFARMVNFGGVVLEVWMENIEKYLKTLEKH
jgi:hypothetical protein